MVPAAGLFKSPSFSVKLRFFHASFASTVLKKGSILCTPSRLIIKSRNAGPFSITGVADAVSDSDSDL